MTSAPFAVISGGGTGGHTFLALAIARALESAGHDPQSIELVGSRRGQEAALLAGERFPLTLLPGRGIVRRTGPADIVANVRALWGLAWATCREVAVFARHRPKVVVSVGGYASFPADLAAAVLGVPLVLVTVDAVPGAVHRLFARRAAANAVAFAGTRLPRSVVTGVAVRSEIADVERSPDAAVRARKELGLPTQRLVVGVVGGSLGARRLNLAAAELAQRWAGRRDLAIYHVTGWRDWEEMRGRRAGGGNGTDPDPGPDASSDPAGLWVQMVPFEDRMARLYEAVDVMVCRAGAGTVAELTVTGVPAVLVPLPGAPGDHQSANAKTLGDADAAVVLPDAQCDAIRLETVLDAVLSDPGRLEKMGAAARSLGRPDAAGRVAALVEAHAR